MKTIEEMLLNLARPEVVEFGLVSNRLPSVNVGGKFEPVDTRAPNTDTVLQMLVTMGGSRYVESLSPKPTQWTARLEGVGVVAIAAIMRDEIVQARFTVARRDAPKSGGAIAAAQPASGSAAAARPEQPAAAPQPAPAAAAPQGQPPPLPSGAFRPPAAGVPRGAAPPAAPAPPPPPPPPENEFDDDDELTVQTMTPSVASGLPSGPLGPPTTEEPVPEEAPRPKPPRTEERPISVTNIQAVAPPVDAALAPTAPQEHPPAPPTPAPPSSSTAVDDRAPEASPPSSPTAVQIVPPGVHDSPPSLTALQPLPPPPQAMPARRVAAAAPAQPASPPEAPPKQQSAAAAVASPAVPANPPQQRRVFSAKDTQKIPTPTRRAGLPGGVALSNVEGASQQAPQQTIVAAASEELSEADATDPTIDIVVEQSFPPRGGPKAVAPLPGAAHGVAVAPVAVVAPPPASVTPAIVGPMSQPASTDRGGPPEGPDGEMESVVEQAVLPGPPPTDPAALETHLHVARQVGASDVYLVSDRPAVFRVATDIMPKGSAVPAEALARIVAQVVPDRLSRTLEATGSCDFALQHGVHGRFRANVSRQRTGWKMTLRAIARETPTLQSLGLPESLAAVAAHRRGLVLVTGPAGHGKTSTVAALVDVINRVSAVHVLTIEAPIEHVHARKRALISQLELGTHARTFSRAIATALRADADVIVGDLGDAASVRAALVAVEAGRLVIATMSTPSVARTIDAILDLFPRAEQPIVRATLASNLRFVVGQRLVPSANRTRVHAACELLPGSRALFALVRDGKTAEIPSLGRGKGGFVRLDDSLADLVRSVKVTLDTAKVYAEVPHELEAQVSGADKRREKR